MATRVLIVNRQLVFAVTLKQALEQTGSFDVHPFTTADAAFDFLREHPQDVALVDFTLPGRSGAKVIQQLRAIQSDLAVIISPRQPDADALMNSLRLQGMIDMPFGARDIIPLIERAVEQAQQMPPGSGEPTPLPSSAPPQTARLDENPPEPPPQITTKMLGDEGQLVRKQFGTTQLFDDADEDDEQAPAQTRNLDEPPQPPAPPPKRPAETRRFDESQEVPRIKPLPRDSEKRDTGETNAPFPPIKPLKRNAETKRFDESQEVPQIKPLRREPAQTAKFDEPPPPPPQTTPELSSLESVLQSFGFDPPIEVEDTPAVPTSNNEALRQFLATADQTIGGAEQFDDVLGAIDPSDLDEVEREETPFEGLVKSMQRSDDSQRQQKLTDFTLTSGMDAVLREIARSKTAPLSDVPPPPEVMPEEPSIPDPKPKTKPKPQTTFEKLAQEEPPPPTFEESGTVGDLMLGVSDSGFRNVLSLLRGDELDEDAPPRPERQSKPADPFADFFAPPPGQPSATPSEAAEVLRAAVSENRSDTYQFDDFDAEDEPGEATVAQVILQTALEDTQLPDGFSLNQLLTDIENRLSMHKLAVKPLPSWNMDTGVFRPVSEAEIREPDFLPEEIPPGEVVSPDTLLEFEEPDSYTGRTTRASLANQWARPSVEPEEDTLFDSRFVEETTASESIRISEAAEEQTPEYLPESEIEDTARSEVIEDEGIPTGALLLDEIADEPVADSWDDEPEMQEGSSFLAPLLKNAPPVGDVPEPPADEAEEEDVWDVPAQAEWVAPEFEQPTQSVQDIDWGAVPEAVNPWDAEAEEEVIDEGEPEWQLPTGDAAWDIQPQESAGTAPFVGEWEQPAEEAEQPAAVDDWQLPPEESEWEVQPESVGDLLRASDEWELPDVEDEQAVPEDPYLAQLALNLTQFSLESSSEGSILTRGGEIVAYAGHLSEQDTIELRDTINNDWDANPEGARIRFITLPSSGMDYMLYSIRTDGDLTLSMIFAGTTPLKVIRQQGQRLIAALESIPDVIAEEPEPAQIVPVETPVDESQLNAYSFVWLVRDPEAHLTDAVAQAMMAGLTIQLQERGWKINNLQVHEDFVYLYAGVPGETPSHEIMRDLKRRSADIAHTQDIDLTPQMLWADAYLILAPGRELQTEEILEFINFQRMA